MKVPNFSWDQFLSGGSGDTVTWRMHLGWRAAGDNLIDVSAGLDKSFVRPRKKDEGAGTIEIPDDWLLACDSRGRPLRPHQKNPHHWLITEKGWDAVREEARERHDDHGGKHPFAGHEEMIVSNARYWQRILERRKVKSHIQVEQGAGI